MSSSSLINMGVNNRLYSSQANMGNIEQKADQGYVIDRLVQRIVDKIGLKLANNNLIIPVTHFDKEVMQHTLALIYRLICLNEVSLVDKDPVKLFLCSLSEHLSLLVEAKILTEDDILENDIHNMTKFLTNKGCGEANFKDLLRKNNCSDEIESLSAPDHLLEYISERCAAKRKDAKKLLDNLNLIYSGLFDKNINQIKDFLYKGLLNTIGTLSMEHNKIEYDIAALIIYKADEADASLSRHIYSLLRVKLITYLDSKHYTCNVKMLTDDSIKDIISDSRADDLKNSVLKDSGLEKNISDLQFHLLFSNAYYKLPLDLDIDILKYLPRGDRINFRKVSKRLDLGVTVSAAKELENKYGIQDIATIGKYIDLVFLTGLIERITAPNNVSISHDNGSGGTNVEISLQQEEYNKKLNTVKKYLNIFVQFVKEREGDIVLYYIDDLFYTYIYESQSTLVITPILYELIEDLKIIHKRSKINTMLTKEVLEQVREKLLQTPYLMNCNKDISNIKALYGHHFKKISPFDYLSFTIREFFMRIPAVYELKSPFSYQVSPSFTWKLTLPFAAINVLASRFGYSVKKAVDIVMCDEQSIYVGDKELKINDYVTRINLVAYIILNNGPQVLTRQKP